MCCTRRYCVSVGYEIPSKTEYVVKKQGRILSTQPIFSVKSVMLSDIIGNDFIYIMNYIYICLFESLTIILHVAGDISDNFHYRPHAFVSHMTNFMNCCKFWTNY